MLAVFNGSCEVQDCFIIYNKVSNCLHKVTSCSVMKVRPPLVCWTEQLQLCFIRGMFISLYLAVGM